MLSISLGTVRRFSETRNKYVSSAYLSRMLTAFRGWRSELTTTYDGVAYHRALYDRSIYGRKCRHQSFISGNKATLIKIIDDPIVDAIWNIHGGQYRAS